MIPFLDAGANLIGNIVSNVVGAKNQRLTNESNERIAKDNRKWQTDERIAQNAYNTDMWNKTNEYNTTSAQVKRMRDAGINPYLAMSGSAGSASGGNTSAMSSASAPGAPNMPNQQAFMPHFSPINLTQAINQSKLTNAQSNKLSSETTGINTNNSYLPELLNLQLQTGKESKTGLQLDNRTKQLSNDYLQDTYKDRIQQQRLINDYTTAQTAGQQLDNQTKKILNEFMPVQQQADLMVKYAQQLNMLSNVQLSKQQIKESHSRIRYNLAQEILSHTQSNVNKKQLDVMDSNIQNINATTDNTKSKTSINKVEYKKAEQTANAVIDAILQSSYFQSVKSENDKLYEQERYKQRSLLPLDVGFKRAKTYFDLFKK